VVLGQTGHRLGRNRIDGRFHASRVFLREVTHEERKFRALFITRTEIRESVIYDGKQQDLVEWEGQNQPEIELDDATVVSCTIKSLENSVDLGANAH
jgi:hypothetical protein